MNEAKTQTCSAGQNDSDDSMECVAESLRHIQDQQLSQLELLQRIYKYLCGNPCGIYRQLRMHPFIPARFDRFEGAGLPQSSTSAEMEKTSHQRDFQGASGKKNSLLDAGHDETMSTLRQCVPVAKDMPERSRLLRPHSAPAETNVGPVMRDSEPLGHTNWPFNDSEHLWIQHNSSKAKQAQLQITSDFQSGTLDEMALPEFGDRQATSPCHESGSQDATLPETSHHTCEPTSDIACCLKTESQQLASMAQSTTSTCSSFGSANGSLRLTPTHESSELEESHFGSCENNDNNGDLESLIEVSGEDETSKLTEFINKLEAQSMIDPNQCIVCKRTLSCKSALLMHYRVHVCGRPFKCRVCHRAFTTKCNLRTHLAVHNIRCSSAHANRCQVCSERMDSQVSAVVSGSHTPSVQSRSTALCSIGSSASWHSSLCIDIPGSPEALAISGDASPKFSPPSPPINKAASIDPLVTSPVSVNNTMTTFTLNPTRHPIRPAPIRLHSNSDSEEGTAQICHNQRCRAMSASSFDKRLRGTSSMDISPVRLQSNFSLPSANPFCTVMLPSPKQVRFVTSHPKTACVICFKKFACTSALKIHYRSHTKERPFKCSICGRGFTTKGNMKQHLLTHSTKNVQVVGSSTSQTDDSITSPLCSPVFSRSSSPVNQDSETFSQLKSQCSSTCGLTTASAGLQDPTVSCHMQSLGSPTNASSAFLQEASPGDRPTLRSATDASTISPLESIRRMWANTQPDPPLHRDPLTAKHQCGLCNKIFSSASALHIHMRTHTGDRPFKCDICHRAFTTKGNLKVHTSTHMWPDPPTILQGWTKGSEWTVPPIADRDIQPASHTNEAPVPSRLLLAPNDHSGLHNVRDCANRPQGPVVSSGCHDAPTTSLLRVVPIAEHESIVEVDLSSSAEEAIQYRRSDKDSNVEHRSSPIDGIDPIHMLDTDPNIESEPNASTPSPQPPKALRGSLSTMSCETRHLDLHNPPEPDTSPNHEPKPSDDIGKWWTKCCVCGTDHASHVALQRHLLTHLVATTTDF